MSSVTERLFRRGGSGPPAIHDQLQEALQKAAELTSKIRECESDTLLPLASERTRLATLTRQRLDLQADAFMSGRDADTSIVEADIASCTARVLELEARADVVSAAHAKLRRQLLEQQNRIRALQEVLPREQLTVLEERLIGSADAYRTAIERLNAALVEVAAIAAAYDSVGPKVAGFTGVASRGMASIDLPAPRHPAFKDLGGLQKLGLRVEARKQEILQELAQS